MITPDEAMRYLKWLWRMFMFFSVLAIILFILFMVLSWKLKNKIMAINLNLSIEAVNVSSIRDIKILLASFIIAIFGVSIKIPHNRFAIIHTLSLIHI